MSSWQVCGFPLLTISIQVCTTLSTTFLLSEALTFKKEGKKWIGLIFLWLLQTSRTIGKFVCITVEIFLVSLHNHMSFLRLTFWLWSKFCSSEKKTKLSKLLMFQPAQQVLCADQVIFCFFRHELFSLHYIVLVSKVPLQNSSERVPLNLEILSTGVN